MVTAPYDENDIGSDELIIRRISAQYVVPNENTGGLRLSSMAFQPSSGLNSGMSVDVETLIVKSGLDPKNYVKTPVFTGAVAFSAGDVRALNLMVGYDPLEENPYHGEVWGNTKPNHFSGSQKKGLRQVSKWYVELPDVDIV